MKITFLGATHEVTGSCTLLETQGHKFLVDCGMEQGKNIFENQKLPVNPGDIDFVLLTHAHIDHSGNLPLLARGGFKGSVYATEASCSLADIMLRDSTHIQLFEAQWRNRKAKRAGKEEYTPLYDMADTEVILKHLRPCKYGEKVRVLENVEVRFTDIGHLLGSACIEIWVTENGETQKLVFSGDVGNINKPIVNDPKTVSEADCVIIESTYGDRLHDEHPDNIETLAEIIERTFKRGGNVVIPSFAVGRTQEILYYLRRIKEEKLVSGFDGFEVYIDSPLALEATNIYIQTNVDSIDAEAAQLVRQGINPFWFEGLVCSTTSAESKAINENPRPKVILSASGMCEAGRIRHHLKHNLWRSESTVLFAGYQAEGTLGRIIYDGAKKVKLFGEEIEVKAEICYLPGISGHADKNGLLAWLSGFEKKPKRVFVNHGDDSSCTAFCQCLSELGYSSFAPYSGTVYELFSDNLEVITQGVPIIAEEFESGSQRSRELNRQLVDAAQNLLNLTKKLKGRPNKEIAALTEQINRLFEENI